MPYEFQAQYMAGPEDRLKVAFFRFYIPETTKVVRAVLCASEHETGGYLFKNEQWRKFAQRHDCAIMEFHLRGPNFNPVVHKYRTEGSAETGAGRAFYWALEDFAQQTNHPELAHAPVFLWGISAAARQVCNLAEWKPQRVLAYVPYHGSGDANVDQLGSTPAFLITGGAEGGGVNPAAPRGRQQGALWSRAVEPGIVHHLLGNSNDMVLSYFATILKARLPDDYEQQVLKGPVKLKELKASDGWLGAMTYDAAARKMTAGAVAPFAAYQGDRTQASWFPTEDIARKWQTYVNEGRCAVDPAYATNRDLPGMTSVAEDRKDNLR